MQNNNLSQFRSVLIDFMDNNDVEELFKYTSNIKSISSKCCTHIYKVSFTFKKQLHIYKVIRNINNKRVLNYVEQYNNLSMLEIPYIFPTDIYPKENYSGLIFSMPYCPATLYRFKEYKETKFENVQTLLKSLISSLSNLHLLSVYHGNIKPSNIFIHQDGNLYLSDLGLNDIRPEDDVQSGEVIQFLSPEQLFGYEVNCKTDMWNIGCIIYYLLTQKYIFTYKNIHQFVNDYRECDTLHFPNLPIKFQILLKRLIKLDPNKRLNIEELDLELYVKPNALSYNSFRLLHNPVFRIDNKLLSEDDITQIALNNEDIFSIKYILTGLANSYMCTGEIYYIFIIVNILWHNCSSDRKECVKKIIEKCNGKYKHNQISLAIISSVDRSYSLSFNPKYHVKKQISMFSNIFSNNIKYLSLLRHLDLSCLNMKYDGVMQFFNNIMFKKLTVLALPQNEIEDSAVELLVNNMSNMKKLQVLDLSLNRITDVGAKYISSKWNNISELDTLDLTGNYIKTEGGKSLSEFILRFDIDHFKYLGLVNNRIGDEALVLFKNNLDIFIFDDDKDRRVLDLEGMNVGDKTMEVIMDGDEIKDSVTDIIFRNNNLTIDGLNYFAKNYTRLTLLKRLFIAGNKNIRNTDIIKKIEMLKKDIEISNS